MMRAADHTEVLERRRQRMRAFGAGVMLLGFTAFSARANIHAHLGGFVAGMLLGGLAPKVPLRPAFQTLLGVATLALVVLSWRLSVP